MKRKIVCLCGSTKFEKAFKDANFYETMAGNIVLSVGCFKHDNPMAFTFEEKRDLDALHLDKIDMSDEVYILNVDGYIGESTARELAYAIFRNKDIRFWEKVPGERYMETNAHKLGAYASEFISRMVTP